ncbi:MAG: carbohydrate kinase [Chloroflexi bacterium]|nr:carbohydrate kinase [Chloroflexota bacterium]
MDRARLEEITAGFAEQRLVVLGDYFLDRYLEIDRTLAETSLETGLEAHQVTAIRNSPGAAGNVAANLAALGVHVAALGVIGEDGQGYDLARELDARDIDSGPLFRLSDRFTPTYTKPLMHEPDGRVHELSRLDVKNRQPLEPEVEDAIVARLAELLAEADGVVVADQAQERNCGVVTDRVRQALVDLAGRQARKVFLVDSRTRIGEFGGLFLKPNEREAIAAVHPGAVGPFSLDLAAEAGRALAARGGRPVFVTVGEMGVLVCDGAGSRRVPAVPVHGEIDIVGAGDSTMAGLAAALASGAGLAEAALVGNLVASVTIRQLGTTGTATPAQVLEAFSRWQPA